MPLRRTELLSVLGRIDQQWPEQVSVSRFIITFEVLAVQKNDERSTRLEGKIPGV